MADRIKQHTANRRLAQWRVMWLIEHSTSHQLLWCIHSFVLRNRQQKHTAKPLLKFISGFQIYSEYFFSNVEDHFELLAIPVLCQCQNIRESENFSNLQFLPILHDYVG